jgi:double-stranded uracil-DNA glycosylase
LIVSVKASIGFAPLEPAAGAARVLVLGSLPGVASLAVREYYAHPRNAFWRIMAELFDFDVSLAYSRRAALLVGHGIAVWDVLAAGERPGSLDANILRDSEQANDIAALLQRHPQLSLIAFNGNAATSLFVRHIGRKALTSGAAPHLVTLPSTSPAYAGMSYARKLASWRSALAPTARRARARARAT